MNDEELEQRRAEIIATEITQPVVSWWLSFADENGCRGVCIVDAPGFMLAVTMANMHGCNPGGEVQGFEVPPDSDEFKWERNKLFTIEELRAGGVMTLKEWEASHD